MHYVKTYILFLLSWFSGLPIVFAQRGWPPVYEIKADSAFFTLDTAYYQLLEDPQGNYSLAQVHTSTAFRYDARYNPVRQGHVYWMRMRIKNALSRPLNLYLRDFSSYTDMYWRDSSNRWQHQRTGDLVPRSQLPSHKGDKDQNRLYFQLGAGQQTTIYQRSQNVLWRWPLTYLAPQFQTEESRKDEIFQYYRVRDGWKDSLFAGIAIGILFLAICYNLLIFFSTKERVYLYFSVCLLFFVLDRNTSYIQLTFFAEQPYLFGLISNLFFIAFFTFFVQSIRRFIQPGPALSGLNRATIISLGLTALLNVLLIGSLWYPFVPTNIITIGFESAIRVVYALCLLMTYRMMKQGAPDAWYVFVAIAPLFIWWLYTLTGNIVGLSFQIDLNRYLLDLFRYAEIICLSWMVIFFSAALINRYNLTRQQVVQQAIEREQLQKEREMERNRIIASQNERLEQQVRERTTELRQSLETLKATQNQLIQKEKLASLGELTAGIAHEIQNPLNFVNNFSEVNIELIEELRDEYHKPAPDEALKEEILTDLQQNLQKINQHGKRAGAIVKGMLEHSRTSTGEKQLTNLNALADEHLRLAYHGLRASDKTFNCQLVTNFDPELPSVNIVTQDMGRALLNLYNNAFYAVREKALKDVMDKEISYQPCVTAETQLDGNNLIIRVCDNGMGIPEAVKGKIFQPFFTTKPTGQGTGLGLSLAYDIITKGHGGELTVDSQEQKNTVFTIRLPIK